MTDNNAMEAMVDRSADVVAEGEHVRIGDLVDSFGARGYGALIALFALASLVLTAVPGTSVVLGIVIALVGAQYAAGTGRAPWLPTYLRRIEIKRSRAQAAITAAGPWAQRIDRLVSMRAASLTRGWFTLLWGVVVMLLGILLVPLALAPGGVVPPSLILILLGVTIAARDGVLLSITGAMGMLFFAYGLQLVF